ncbi:RDD family protein [Aquabacterium soli]|uniref:RDD family protein n=1 Tax=Aquabacterium soli TaxID=2493092 RepID=A0A3R8S1B3_9BURK|nr:RDD family protein [Aquabacterium soli]RRS03059.1 RDD family protein [Aquabacterium soli]
MLRPPVAPPLTWAQCAERAAGPAAPLKRRLAAFIYEGVLLFGVVMLVGMVFGVATQQRHALHGREGLQAALFLALSLYFIWFWTQGGQTLAMKTWHVRLVRHDGLPLTLAQATGRAVLSWLWFAPPLLLAWAAQWHHGKSIGSLLTLWMVAYALSSFFLPRRQFLHDVLCGTRVIDTRP